MKCTIPGSHLKIFGKAIHSLSKIGDEVYFEPLPEGLALRTVNASRSAYACFIFAPPFFIHYDDGSRLAGHGKPSDQDEEAIKCKVGVKSCMTVFKSLATLEKTVERCKISLNMDEARLVFQLHCRHGIVKTHNLAFIECETLQAVFSKDMTPNKLTAQSRLLCDAVVNFQTTQEEVTLCVNPEKLVLKNYVDDEPDPNKVIRTELGVDPEEFESYQVGVDADVTFCLKELRAILAFSEGANLPVSLHFETSGRPIVFSIDSDATFEGNFVLATLADPSKSLPSTQQSTQQSTQSTVRNHARPQNQTRSSHTRRPAHASQRPAAQLNGATHGGDGATHGRDGATHGGDGATHGRDGAAHGGDGAAYGGDGDRESSHPHPVHPQRERRKQSHGSRHQGEWTGTEDDSTTLRSDDPVEGTSSMVPQVSHSRNLATNESYRSSNDQQSTVRTVTNQRTAAFRSANQSSAINTNQTGEQGSGDGISPDIPVQASEQTRRSVLLGESSDETASEEEDVVPGTPPAKKFKSLFFGLSQGSTQVSQRPPANKPTVLAEDTDEDD